MNTEQLPQEPTRFAVHDLYCDICGAVGRAKPTNGMPPPADYFLRYDQTPEEFRENLTAHLDELQGNWKGDIMRIELRLPQVRALRALLAKPQGIDTPRRVTAKEKS